MEWWKSGGGQGKGREESKLTPKVLASAIWWMVPLRETRNTEGLE